jgi:hypothetical protein
LQIFTRLALSEFALPSGTALIPEGFLTSHTYAVVIPSVNLSWLYSNICKLASFLSHFFSQFLFLFSPEKTSVSRRMGVHPVAPFASNSLPFPKNILSFKPL